MEYKKNTSIMKSRMIAFVVFVIVGVAHCQPNPDVPDNTTAVMTTRAGNTTTVVTPTTETTVTDKPTTVPTTVPTTTKPTPHPGSYNPPVQSYLVKDATTGNFCILLQAGIRLLFNYSTGGDKNKTVHFDLPKTENETDWQHVEGSCGNVTQTITLHLKKDWSVTLKFNKSKNDISLSAAYVNFSMSKEDFPGATKLAKYNASMQSKDKLETPNTQGYRCNKNNSIPFNLTLTPLAELITVSLKMEAFRTNNKTKLEEDYTQCEQDNDISNLVPIIVGAALGGLVLIVLIAYLVGRKRNQRGYESV